MRNKRLIEKIKLVLGDEQMPIDEIVTLLSQLKTKEGTPLTYASLEANRLSKIMRGKFEMVRIGSPKCKRNEWRNKNVMDRKIQTE